jgi:hypothetical protein
LFRFLSLHCSAALTCGTRSVYQTGLVLYQRLSGLEILAYLQSRCGSLSYGRSDLLGAAMTHIARGKNARTAGLKGEWFRLALQTAAVDQIVADRLSRG